MFGEHRRPWYEGMGRVETQIWRDWLINNEQDWNRFDYNVHVGQGVAPLRGAPPLDPAMKARQDAAWIASTQKRIDVVGYRNEGVVLIEITERAGTRALGQLLTYDLLHEKATLGVGSIALLLLCRFIGADMREAFDANGVDVTVVPAR